MIEGGMTQGQMTQGRMTEEEKQVLEELAAQTARKFRQAVAHDHV